MRTFVLAGLLVAQAAAAEVPADRLQKVDAVAREVTAAGDAAQACGSQRKCLEALRKRLDGAVYTLGRLEKDLGLLDRDELAIRVAWKVEPALERATVGMQLAVGHAETDDDRAAWLSRQAAAQLYAWRDDVLHSKKQDPELVFGKIAPLLGKAAPGPLASKEAREDFEQTAEAAAWSLRRALFPQRDLHRSARGRKLSGRLSGILERLWQPYSSFGRAESPQRDAASDLEALEAELAAGPEELPASERSDLLRRVRRFVAMLPRKCRTEDDGPTGDFDKPVYDATSFPLNDRGRCRN